MSFRAAGNLHTAFSKKVALNSIIHHVYIPIHIATKVNVFFYGERGHFRYSVGVLPKDDLNATVNLL